MNKKPELGIRGSVFRGLDPRGIYLGTTPWLELHQYNECYWKIL